MLRPALERLSIRRAVLVGFGLTLTIWLSTAYYYSRGIAEVAWRATAINERYTRAQELLAGVRADVLLASIVVRDSLLDSSAPAVEPRRQLLGLYDAIDRRLARYSPILESPGERDRFIRLRRDIDDFREAMLNVLDSDDRARSDDARALLRTSVVPKRQRVMELSTQIRALNRAAFEEQQAAVARVHQVRQRRTWQSLSLALAASFGIGLFAALHAGRLERRVADQRDREVANARELQEVSSRLITAQEEERRSIARELHDEVGQVLTAIKVELALAGRAIEAGGGPAGVLQEARAVTDAALQTVRDLSHLLHPALLDDLGLPEALTWYVNEFRRRHGIRVEVAIEGLHERLTPDVEACAYRIAQEALTNVVRHASATSCRVRLRCAAGTLRISVEDDGVGFEPQAQSSVLRGLGLVGIRERATQFGGTLRVESAPGAGTRLEVQVPALARISREPSFSESVLQPAPAATG